MARGKRNNYPVNKKLLYVGRTFKNWKEVCGVFSWDYNGNRPAQYDTLGRYCNYIQCGKGKHKVVIITEVFDNPKPPKKYGRPVVDYEFSDIPKEYKDKRGVYLIEHEDGRCYVGKADRNGGFQRRCSDYKSYLKKGRITEGSKILFDGGRMMWLYVQDYNKPNPYMKEVEDFLIDCFRFGHKDQIKNKMIKICKEYPSFEYGDLNWNKLVEYNIVDVTRLLK